MNRKILFASFIFFTVLGIAYWQYNRDKLILEKSFFEGVDEIDTIEAYPQRGLYILGLVRRYGPFGDFDYDLGIEKTDGHSPAHMLRYESNTGFHSNISKDYIAIDNLKIGEASSGWFSINDGNILPRLPDIEYISDSLQKAADTSVFVQYRNGYISLNVNGKSVKDLNYGNLRTKHKYLNFDSLDYSLYKIDGDSIIVASKNADDLFKQKSGIFFIPKPGYGIKYKYSKKAILDCIDSVYNLSSPPVTIRMHQVE